MMAIDFTAELAPVLWAMVGILVLACGAIASMVDTHEARRPVFGELARWAFAKGAFAVRATLLCIAVKKAALSSHARQHPGAPGEPPPVHGTWEPC